MIAGAAAAVSSWASAGQLSVRLLVAAIAEQIMSEGRAAGLGEADIAGLVQIHERLGGMRLG